ncbi:hypothetical protein AA0Y32_06300 [Georgenia phoenicis]|uniref:hypothetical protein n=1 Tax=unclassified Georgenia TaxID=2626815 RepID=UPI0039AF5849
MLVRRSLPTLAATLLAVLMTSGCLDVGPETAYCEPTEPVVTPGSVARREELRVEVTGVVDADDCEPSLPEGARYSVEITSEARAEDGRPFSASLGDLDPGRQGDAGGSFRLPADFPLGGAEVSVKLEGAATQCKTDPTVGCAPAPSVTIDVTG